MDEYLVISGFVAPACLTATIVFAVAKFAEAIFD